MIAQCQRLVVLLGTWRDPVPFKRAWCLYEILCALDGELEVDMHLPPKQVELFLAAFSEEADVIETFLRMPQSATSQATESLDQDHILRCIEERGGFDQLDSRIRERMQPWCLKQARSAIQRLEAAGPSRSLARLRGLVSHVLTRFDVLDEAMKQYKKSLQLYINLLGDDEPEKAQCYCYLAQICIHEKMFATGLALYEKGLALLEGQANIEASYDIAVAQAGMGSACLQLGDASRAVNLLQTAINGLSPSPPSAEFVVAQHCLGRALAEQGEPVRASKVLREAMETADLVDMPESERSSLRAALHFHLAQALHQQSLPTQALDHVEACLAIELCNLGEQHVDLAPTYHLRALVQQALGELDSALASFTQEAAIWEASDCLDHVALSQAYGAIGEVLKEQGQGERALVQFQKALDTAMTAANPDRLNLAQLHDKLASAYLHEGQLDQAAEHARTCLTEQQALLDENDASLATSYFQLASIYRRQGKLAEALELYERDLEISLKVHGNEHGDTALTYFQMAMVLHRLKKDHRAIEHLHHCLNCCIPALGKFHERTADAYAWLGILYNIKGNLRSAAHNLKECVAIRLQVLGSEHPDTLLAQENLKRVQQFSKAS
ncbi:uncharacterized protein MONBRDRAFT_26095 [Monosiga brevicollis MX1]|uniref:Uncharacterized protein n=1 Tax=Monosiga brevicollis TaxID=81824 RepID=A9V1C3_MONBE|nr:uncharacterized protein MONBRDRAFT_26095 [Monosiga brevicollis MX1]EDQ88416.1 predicted protein [Monosiga brevicollis MX1]|eukprot:XP_001746520.1 hypothetical protein [Monosiga brevicollis MX1]